MNVLSCSFFTSNLWVPFYMALEKELDWFICLYGNVRRSPRPGASVFKSTNRTVIVMTAKPVALLTLMNASEENGIADAADKASKLLNTKCDKMYDGMEMPQRFETLCILGPISNYELAERITSEWIKSRGAFPRTSFAQNLADTYNIDITVHSEALFGVCDLNVDVKILGYEGRSTKLAIYPKSR